MTNKMKVGIGAGAVAVIGGIVAIIGFNGGFSSKNDDATPTDALVAVDLEESDELDSTTEEVDADSDKEGVAEEKTTENTSSTENGTETATTDKDKDKDKDKKKEKEDNKPNSTANNDSKPDNTANTSSDNGKEKDKPKPDSSQTSNNTTQTPSGSQQSATTDGNKPQSSGSNQPTTTESQKEKKKVWHEPVYEVKKTKKPIYKDVEIMETVYCDKCNGCGALLYTQADISTHFTAEAVEAGCGSWGSYSYQRGTGTYESVIWDWEETEEKVLVQEGYWDYE